MDYQHTDEWRRNVFAASCLLSGLIENIDNLKRNKSPIGRTECIINSGR